MKRRARALGWLALPLLAANCPNDERPPAPPPVLAATPAPSAEEQAAAARRTIAAWLECDECTDGELEAVLRLGSRAVPTLSATLERGPSPAARELARRELRARYAELEQRARARGTPLPATDVDAWLDRQIEAYVARYQVRSAQALARLGGPDAQRALLAAQASGSLRADVAGEVRKALDELDAHP